MSLNGLDAPDVQEAYQTAVAEAGGWFLLKYASRDSVELLGRGKGGVHEARAVVASQTEKSPLYGLIIYRRRKVLLKYIPEGTSRVLLARTAVHWQDVLDKYSPADTTVDISTPEGFNDTALASSFPLHTATPSASSSRLDEINEDEDEEDGGLLQTPISPSTSTSSYLGSQRQRMDRRVEHSPPPAIHIRGDSMDKPAISPGAAAPRKSYISKYFIQDSSGQQSISSVVQPAPAPVTQYATAEDARDVQDNALGAETPKAATTPTTPLFKPLPNVPSPVDDTPKVPQKFSERYKTPEVRVPNGLPEQQTAERPTTSATISSVSDRSKYDDDPYDLSKWDIKPKQKLGPRPVVPGEKKRPTVASISSVPATYRPTMKKPEVSRPKSQGPGSSIFANPGVPKGIPAPPPIPDAPEYSPRPLSRGSIKSLPSHKSTAMTPDKIRLMKAVELRKKQLRKSNPQANTFVPPPDEDVPAIPAIPAMPEAVPKREADTEQSKKQIATPRTVFRDEQVTANKADSGIEFEHEKLNPKENEQPKEIATIAQQPRDVSHESPQAAIIRPAEDSSPQSQRVDTPREIIGHTSDRDKVQRHIVEASTQNEDFSQIPTPRAPAETRFQSNPDSIKPEDYGENDGPTLPMSRHALPVDNTVRNQSIDSSQLSEDDAVEVPTIMMQDGSRPLSAIIQDARSEDSNQSESDPEQRHIYETANSSGDLQPPDQIIRRQNSDIAKRRRGFVEPLHIDPDDEYDSDDDFMAELQTATLQEAKPVTVARSPVAHYFPRRPSNNSAISDQDVHSVRTVTMGDRASTTPLDYTDSEGRLSPGPYADSPDHARSISTVSTEKFDPMASFTRSVSSGISRRIQALAEKSSQEKDLNDTLYSSRPTSPEVSTNYSSTRGPPSPNPRTSSFRAMSRHSSRISAYQSLLGSPTPPPDNNNNTNNTVWNVENNHQGGVESVSVSARIVRASPAETAIPSPDTNGDLRPSQLVVSSHKRGIPSQPSVPLLQKIDTKTTPDESTGSRTTSPTMVRGSVDGARQLHSASKFGRHKPTSPTVDDFPAPPPSIKPQSTQPVSAFEDSVAPKETTRTGRFLKRMSNIGNKRRSIVAQSIASSTSPASERGSMITNNLPGSKDKSDLPPALTVGDLNIQFPDSLLWKRRIVEIDEAGYVTFSISQAMEHQRGATKKYQLSEFRMPYIPDLDRQELPNSILLDFNDGTTLQIACEDSMTHRQVTNVLKSYWRAWTTG